MSEFLTVLTLRLSACWIIGQLRTLRQTLILILVKKYKIYYIKIIPLNLYLKELSNDIIFMSNISYFLN
jgi:hypothetical protein